MDIDHYYSDSQFIKSLDFDHRAMARCNSGLDIGVMSMSNQEVAHQFFIACETGKGWEVCKQWCEPDAGFSAQADALAEVTSLAAYCDWMQGLLTPIPDGRYELKAMSYDTERSVALFFAVFHGSNTVEGPVPPTGNTVASDYVYSIEFSGDKIRHMTKIWNDAHALKQLGWA